MKKGDILLYPKGKMEAYIVERVQAGNTSDDRQALIVTLVKRERFVTLVKREK